MICSNCNEKNEAGAKFCFVCGTKLESIPVHPVQKAQQIKGREYYPSTAPIRVEEKLEKKDLSTRPLVMAALVLAEGNKEYQLPFKQEVLIGRADISMGINPDVELSDIDKESVSSRRHAIIIMSGRNYFIKDLGSMNGTFVNNIKLDSSVECSIKNGDKIKIGKLIFTFKCNN